jgi:hypothetical protein
MISIVYRLNRSALSLPPVVDIERPVKLASSYQVAFFLCRLSGIEWNESALEAAVSTVDHADIRGSAEAAVMVMIRRELPLTMLVGLATIKTVEDSPSSCCLEC